MAKGLVPPVIWNTASLLKRTLLSRVARPPESGEKDSLWYNQTYRNTEEYRRHYTGSIYYFMWTVIADRLVRIGARSVLDIGCGPGQLASFLRDKGIPRYLGIDLSEEAITLARSVCPEYIFRAVNVFETDVLEKCDYDEVIALEFLEHVQDDTGVLQRIPKGRRFIGSVPNFPYISHVRHFSDCQEVEDRYGSLFGQFRVDAFMANDKGKTFYLFEGVKS